MRAGPPPCNAPGGEGDSAEGRTPFAALRAGASGGLMERSDLPTADTSRTLPHLHQARFALPYPFSATQAPCPCLRSACHCPSPARQRSTRRQRRELLQGHPSRAALPGGPAREHQGRRRQENCRARPRGWRGPGHRVARRLTVLLGSCARAPAVRGSPAAAAAADGALRGARLAGYPPGGSCALPGGEPRLPLHVGSQDIVDIASVKTDH